MPPGRWKSRRPLASNSESRMASSSSRFTTLPKAGVELAQAAAQVNRTGTPEQIQQAAAVLDEARKRLYSILAQD